MKTTRKIIFGVIFLLSATAIFAQIFNTSAPINDGFIFVEGGEFRMGSNSGLNDEKPVHSVTVSSFYICDHEVTQAEYKSVMGTSPSWFSGDNKPVEKVSWLMAIEYCNKLSEKKGLTECYIWNGESYICNFNANGYRLPTEAEWEFAARGGNKSKGYTYSGSHDSIAVAWFEGGTQDVKTKQPNELGIYDMSGNVWEWCWDWYGDYSSDSQTNPQGASYGNERIARGGSIAYKCSVTYRGKAEPSYKNSQDGFRVVRTAGSLNNGTASTTAQSSNIAPIPQFDKKLYKEVSIRGEKVFKWVMLASFAEYDTNGNEIHSQTSSGYEEWYEYDSYGNKIHTKNSLGDETWYEYDSADNLLYEKWSDGDECWYEYDSDGNMIHEEWSYGAERWCDYDSDGNMIHEKNTWEGDSWYEYDQYGNPTYYKCGSVEIWYQFTADGKKLREEWAGGDEIRYEYDWDGNLVRESHSRLGDRWYEYTFYPDGAIKTKAEYKPI